MDLLPPLTKTEVLLVGAFDRSYKLAVGKLSPDRPCEYRRGEWHSAECSDVMMGENDARSMARGERDAREDGTGAREVWGRNQERKMDHNKILIDV